MHGNAHRFVTSGLVLGLALAGCGNGCAHSEGSGVATETASPPAATPAPAPAPEPGSAPPREHATPEPSASGDREPRPIEPEHRAPPHARGNPQAACRQAGGQWRQFRNTCVDSCRLARSGGQLMCGMALTMGCDCGPDRCWDGATCMPNPGSKGGKTGEPPIRPQPPRDPAPRRYALVVQFMSIGAGTDAEARQRLDALVAERERAWGTKISHRTTHWGREGESDVCFSLAGLSDARKRALIQQIRAEVAAKSPTVRMSEGGTCHAERSRR